MIRWLTLPVIAGLFLFAPGCKDRDQTDERTVAEDTDVDEGLFGGTKVEKKKLIEKDGKYELREKETKLDEQGNVVEQESETKRPNRDTSVDVQAGEGGVDVDVKTPDKD